MWILYTHKKRFETSETTGRRIETTDGQFWEPLGDHDDLEAIGEKMVALGNVDGYSLLETRALTALPPQIH